LAVTKLALRAIVLEQRGILSALGRGIQLLSRRLGRVLLVWLLGVALGTAAGLAVGLAFLILIAIDIASFASLGIQVSLTLTAVLLLVLVVVSPPFAGVVGTYFSTYWTLAFRKLELEPAMPYPIVPSSPSPFPDTLPPVGR
jgi:uncharacterized protein (DUF58 family)